MTLDILIFFMTHKPAMVSLLPMQQIDGKCVDQRKLMSLLRAVYGISNEGRNNFYVEVRTLPL